MGKLRIAAAIMLFWLGGCFEGQGQGVQKGPAEALAGAIAYSTSHYSKDAFRPDGARLEYAVHEGGDAWQVDLGPEGYLGGGLQVIIRKADMKVISALRTQ